MAVVKFQLRRLSIGRQPKPEVSPLRAFILQQLAMIPRARQYRQRMARRASSHAS